MNKFKHYYYNKILKESDKKQGILTGTIELSKLYIRELPSFFKDITVYGSFNIYNNMLTSCKNFPKVNNFLNVYGNKLSSLDGIQMMPLQLDLTHNNLKSLEDLSGLDNVESPYNKIRVCYNELESLEGIEQLHIPILSVFNNNLSTWDFMPKGLKELYISDNKLTSWKGMPENLNTLEVFNNWDVKNLDDYMKVNDSLWLTSSTLKEQDIINIIRKMYPHYRYPDITIYTEFEQ